MAKRHSDAVAIQQGACNPSGIARALVSACDEASAEGKRSRDDAAVRLIVHQLAFLCGTDALNSGTSEYKLALEECEAAIPSTHTTGDGKQFTSMAAAVDHANSVARETGVIISVVEIKPPAVSA